MGHQPIDRRLFLTKASLLLASVGITPLVSSELLSRTARKLFPHAHGAPFGTPRLIDILVRAGAPPCIAHSGAFKDIETAKVPNFPYNLSGVTIQGEGPRQIAYPNSSPLLPHWGNIAVSQGHSANGLPHTGLFAPREGGFNRGLASPVIELANKKVGSYSLVAGVNWLMRATSNSVPTGYQDLVNVNNSADFLGLFKKPTLRLSEQEILAVVETASRLSARQARLLERKIKDVHQSVRNQQKVADLLNTDYSSLLISDEMASGFRMGQNPPGLAPGDIGTAMAQTLLGFKHGLIATATITANTGDWHEVQTIENSRAKSWGDHLASVLAAAIDFLKTTPDPSQPTMTLWESGTLISVTSEFTRSLQFTGEGDNNDGQTNGYILIGANVRGGYYGGVDLAEPKKSSRITGYDPVTALPKPAGKQDEFKNSNEEIYNTTAALLGLDTRVRGHAVLQCLMNRV